MYGYYGYADPLTAQWTDRVPSSAQAKAALETAQPVTKSELKHFFGNVMKVVEAHAVFGCSTCNALAASAVGEVEQARMVQSASGRSIPDPAQIAPIFGSLKRGFCRDPGTSCTNVPMNEALTTVAAWYYRNVELPARGGSSSGSSSRSGSSSTSRAVAHPEPATASGFMGAGKPLHKKPVFWTGIGVVVLLIGGVAFWPKKD